MASPPLQGRAQWVKKPRREMRNGNAVPTVARPGYLSLNDWVKRERDNLASQIDRNPGLRSPALLAANVLGAGAGVARGGYHSVKGLTDAAVFAGRLANPLPDLAMGRTPAAAQAVGAGLALGDYVARGVADPRSVADDIRTVAHQAKADLIPSATPIAPNTSDELARRFAIGMNQGELLYDVGTLAVGGPGAIGVGGALDKAMFVRKLTPQYFLDQGFSLPIAERLAKPYKGMASHYIPRRKKPPSSFVDSPYNRLMPPGISQGGMYELHFPVDLQFNHARLPPSLRQPQDGKVWDGAKLGLKKYGPLRRMVVGMPGPLKARVGGTSLAGGAVVSAAGTEGDSR